MFSFLSILCFCYIFYISYIEFIFISDDVLMLYFCLFDILCNLIGIFLRPGAVRCGPVRLIVIPQFQLPWQPINCRRKKRARNLRIVWQRPHSSISVPFSEIGSCSSWGPSGSSRDVVPATNVHTYQTQWLQWPWHWQQVMECSQHLLAGWWCHCHCRCHHLVWHETPQCWHSDCG